MAEETRTFEELKAEQDKLWAVIESQSEPQGYDAWFRDQTESALKEADDPHAVTYTSDEVDREMAERRAQRDAGLLRRAS